MLVILGNGFYCDAANMPKYPNGHINCYKYNEEPSVINSTGKKDIESPNMDVVRSKIIQESKLKELNPNYKSNFNPYLSYEQLCNQL